MKSIPHVIKEFVLDSRQGQNFVNLPSEGRILTAELIDNQLVLSMVLPLLPDYIIRMYPFLILTTDTSFDGWLNSRVEWQYVTTFRKGGRALHLFFEGSMLER